MKSNIPPISKVISLLQNRTPILKSAQMDLIKAAVLVLLSEEKKGLSTFLTVRSDKVKDHKGQISFPGGVIEENDEDALHAAIREANEEIGLDPDSVQIIGRLDDYITITGYHISPFVGLIDGFEGLEPRTIEIVKCFPFPLGYMLDPTHIKKVWFDRMGKMEEVLFIEYEDNIIWGATARILHNLLEVITNEKV